jgi:glycosyltransferase involved in cell wall biosynthesis
VGTISVVVPNRGGHSIHRCIASLRAGSTAPTEVIIVDRPAGGYAAIDDPTLSPSRILESEARPAEARLLGLRCAKGDYVLFLDSDQEVSRDLVSELGSVAKPCGLVPEDTAASNVLSRLSATRKSASMARFLAHPSISELVAPRMYARHAVLSAYEELARRIPLRALWQHEDSLLFREFAQVHDLDLSKDIYIARNPIFNDQVRLPDLLRKTFAYGANRSAFLADVRSQSPYDADQIREFFGSLDAARPIRGRGGAIDPLPVLYDVIRAPAYVAGVAWGRMRPRAGLT